MYFCFIKLNIKHHPKHTFENRRMKPANQQTVKRKTTAKKLKTKPPKKEGNVFDKIMKEIVEKIFRPLIEERLGVKIVKAVPLKEKMQTTLEVEMDFSTKLKRKQVTGLFCI